MRGTDTKIAKKAKGIVNSGLCNDEVRIPLFGQTFGTICYLSTTNQILKSKKAFKAWGGSELKKALSH